MTYKQSWEKKRDQQWYIVEFKRLYYKLQTFHHRKESENLIQLIEFKIDIFWGNQPSSWLQFAVVNLSFV